MSKGDSDKIRIVEFAEEPVELFKVLKFENLVQSGGEAKHVIAQGLVQVNGKIETRKGKKIFSGDIITFNREKMRVIIP